MYKEGFKLKKRLLMWLLLFSVILLGACGNYSEEDLTKKRAAESSYIEIASISLQEVELQKDVKKKKRKSGNRTVTKKTTEQELHAIFKYENELYDMEFLSENVDVTNKAQKDTVDVWIDAEGDVKGVSSLHLTPASYKEYEQLRKKEDNK